jgi:hypothetical protein
MILNTGTENGALSHSLSRFMRCVTARSILFMICSSSILKYVNRRIQGNVCVVTTRMCRIRGLSFSDDCAGVRPHEVGTCAGEVDEIEIYTEELIVTVLVARPTAVDLVLGAQQQR